MLVGQPPTPLPYAVSLCQAAFTASVSERQAKRSRREFWSDQKTPMRLPPKAMTDEMSSPCTSVWESVKNMNDVPNGAVYPTLILPPDS